MAIDGTRRQRSNKVVFVYTEMKLRLALACLGALVLASVGVGRTADAHLLRGTAIFLDVGAATIEAEVQIPGDQLSLALGADALRAAEATGQGPGSALAAYLRAHLSVRAPDGRLLALDVRSVRRERIDGADSVVARATLRAPGPLDAFDVTSDLVLHRVVTHRIYVLLRHDFRNGLLGGDPRLVGISTSLAPTVHVTRASGSLANGARAAFLLGVRHIEEGSDHILFLLMLLLPAPLLVAGRRWRTDEHGRWPRALMHTLRVVTAFTIGHSTTLLVASLGGLPPGGRVVEVLIAVSILVTAVHALRPIFAGWEPLIAIGFGLVHGLAFASVLAGLGFDGQALAWSIVSFNVGVEVMQLLIAVVVVPAFVVLGRSPRYRFVRDGGGLFGIIASLGWIGERALGLPNPVGPVVDALARRGAWLAAALLVASLVVGIWRPRRRVTSPRLQ